MNRRFRSMSVAIALTLILSGCGNKGPLVLADDVPAAPADAPAVDTPATNDPVTTDPATPPAADDPAAKPPR